MKRYAVLAFLALIACLLVGCGSNEIEPGDKVGGFLVTQGDDLDATFNWDLDCKPEGDAKVFTCAAEVGTNVNASIGIFALGTGKDLDTLWNEHSNELIINDHPVNLEAFGSIDTLNPKIGAMRVWNVVIVGDQPGEIAFTNKGVADGVPFESSMTVTFTAPAK